MVLEPKGAAAKISRDSNAQVSMNAIPKGLLAIFKCAIGSGKLNGI
ncbi:MAG: hypothetical protein Q8P67_28825 [archaeon]|nr:hypothetical protein [archaeon]